jgi:hypothetical protein
MALFAIFLVTLALGLLGSSLVLRMRLVIFEVETVNLVALADGVLSETLASLYVDDSFGGVREHKLGDGKVKSEVRLLDSPGPRQRLYEVVASSSYRRRRRTVRAEVLRVEVAPRGGLGGEDGEVRLRVLSWERVPGTGTGPEVSF